MAIRILLANVGAGISQLSNSHATPAAPGGSAGSLSLARWALLPAILAVSTAAIFVRYADAGPLATAFWRGAVAGLAFLPLFAWPRFRREWRQIPASMLVKVAGATSIIVCHQLAFISSLNYTSVAASTFLTCSQPVFTVFLGRFILGERVGTRSLLAITGAIFGMLLITLSALGEIALTGNLLAVLASILASLFVVFARRLRQSVPLVPFMFTVHLSGSIYLFALAMLLGIDLFAFSKSTWTALLLLGLVPTLIGHSLLNYAIGHLRAFVVNAAILGEPVGATILAALLIGEVPGMFTIVGGLIVIACILVIVLDSTAQPEAESL